MFLNPEKVVEEWDIRPGEKIADFGCGAGFFTLLIGQRTGPNGKVYALDVRPEALEAVKSKIKLSHLFNIETVRADLERDRGSGLKSETMDKVIISNILFQAENKEKISEEAFRVLKTNGLAFIIEWTEKINKESAKNIFKEAGFSFEKEFSAGSHHYGLIFKKP